MMKKGDKFVANPQIIKLFNGAYINLKLIFEEKILAEDVELPKNIDDARARLIKFAYKQGLNNKTAVFAYVRRYTDMHAASIAESIREGSTKDELESVIGLNNAINTAALMMLMKYFPSI